MDRRDFIKLGGAGVAAASSAAVLSPAAQAAAVCSTQPSPTATFKLEIDDKIFEMIDGQRFPFLAYRLTSGSGTGTQRVPGPVLRVVEGNQVTISVTNARPEPHGFEIAGIPDSKITTINTNQTCTVTFTAPVAGTYIYHDGSHVSRHLYRLLGLHGALIVHPAHGMSQASVNSLGTVTQASCMTPYSIDKFTLSDPAAASTVSKVFNAFGTTTRFLGGKWVPCALDQEYSNQEKTWIFNQVDPRFNALITATGITASTLTTSAAQIVANFLPRYFTINGRSGYDLSENEDVVVRNWIGEPTLIRTLNVGLAHHATHMHGNHLLELAYSSVGMDGFKFKVGSNHASNNGEVVLCDNIFERDVWPTAPMQARDMLLPLEVPPDIPNWDKFVNHTNQEPFPLRYVMHCHCEMATTAAGGNYPQGAVTHWEIMGPRGGRRAGA